MLYVLYNDAGSSYNCTAPSVGRSVDNEFEGTCNTVAESQFELLYHISLAGSGSSHENYQAE